MYEQNELKMAQQIRSQYEDRGESTMDKLQKLNRKAKRLAEIFAYTFGVIGSLVLGVGMCLAMKVFANLLPLGVVVGCIGIAMVSANYFIYKKIEKKSKKKYGRKIMDLTDELINRGNQGE